MRRLSALLLVAALAACDHKDRNNPLEPPVPGPDVLLKDMVLSSLPSPFYHFEYDALGRVSGASYASGLLIYEISYAGDRINEIVNTAFSSTDRLRYVYEDGRVSNVEYVNSTGVFTKVALTYDGARLVGLERSRRLNGEFVVDKTITLTYAGDGNLHELIVHRPAIEGFQPDMTIVDRFEQYDLGINVEAFTLLHSDFFDHLILLPGVRLQLTNPRRVTRTGDGTHFVVDYTYTYDDRNRPVGKVGRITVQTGPDAGREFQTTGQFSYY